MVKNPPAMRETWVLSLGLEIPWRREWLPTPVFWPGEFHGQKSLAGYSPWGRRVRPDRPTFTMQSSARCAGTVTTLRA